MFPSASLLRVRAPAHPLESRQSWTTGHRKGTRQKVRVVGLNAWGSLWEEEGTLRGMEQKASQDSWPLASGAKESLCLDLSRVVHVVPEG